MRPRSAAKKLLAGTALLALVSCTPAHEASVRFDLGRPVSEAALAAWNIDVTPDGAGLPSGHGSAREGDELYANRCAQCHDVPAFPQLSGGRGSLKTVPQKTVGSYWPYATTLYDYINRAMPPLKPQSMTPSEVYAVTAYVLSINGIISPEHVLDRQTLPKVVMPNRDGFFVDDGKPDT